uniref:G-protein coupled receptors family 1 profile domain-containing protein n=1 Tax=Takifugu rubripes TaxID=31033 RepID=H2S1Q1_TAKRU
MENFTYNSFILQVEGLTLTEGSVYPAFFLFLFCYLFIIVANVGIATLIFIDSSLQQPMYLLFCNLTFNDILGNSILIPRLLVDSLRPPSERLITYYECVVQAFTTHMFGTTSHTVLMIMATLIKNPYCDNASLFKLSCDSVVINNIYGLTFTAVLLGSSIGSIVLTYIKITIVCVTSNNKSLNSKALKTCSTHLTVFVVLLTTGLSNIALHRYPQHRHYRLLCMILFHIVPGILNPIIYGLQSKEIRKVLSKPLMHMKSLSFS